MLRYLLNPKRLTSINRKQTGCEQKSGPHNRYANSSFPLPGSGIGWISCCVKPHSLLPARHPITRTSPSTGTLLVHKRAALYNKNVVVDSLLRVGAGSPARAWKCANTFRSRRLFNFHLFLIIAFLRWIARYGRRVEWEKTVLSASDLYGKTDKLSRKNIAPRTYVWYYMINKLASVAFVK